MAIKRLNYFNGQFLREEDFTEEQTYHLDMRRRHNLRLHTPGIVFGLAVTPGTGKVTVQPGMAIDVQGREIILGDADTDTVTVEGRLLTGHSTGKLQIGPLPAVPAFGVQITGDLTTTGPVTLPAVPTLPLHAATKSYIDAHTALPNPHSGS